MKLLALTLLIVGASALPRTNPFKWHKADPLFEHQLRTRNMFANPLNTVFNVKSNKVARISSNQTPSYVKPQTRRPDDCGLENVPSEKIINGMEAAPNQFPWVVYVRCTNPGFACTGSLISENWVLSAAHCIEGCVAWTIQAGGNSINQDEPHKVAINTNRAVANDGFNFFNLHDDIGVIYLPEPAPLSDNIRVACLPGRSQLEDQFEDDYVTLTGWGLTSDGAISQPDMLQYVKDRTLMPNRECQSYFTNVNDGMICIDTSPGAPEGSNIGVCSGDSGGPLNLQEGGDTYMQVGVASFVSGFGCEAQNYPHVYARVTYYMDWISDNTGIEVLP